MDLGDLPPPVNYWDPPERFEEELHVARGLPPPPSPHDSKWLTTTAQGGNYTSSSGSTPTYTHARPVHAEIPPRTVPRKFGSDTVLVVDGSAGREKVPFVYSA